MDRALRSKPISMSSQTQTDATLLINFASNLFLAELKSVIEEELKLNEEGVF